MNKGWLFYQTIIITLVACSLPYTLIHLFSDPTPTLLVSLTPTNTITPSPFPSVSPTVTLLLTSPLPEETPTLIVDPATPILPPWTPVDIPESSLSPLSLVEPWLTAPPYPVGTPNRTRPTYRWSAVPGAEEYALWVWLLDKNNEIKELVINQRYRASFICSSKECKVKPDVTLIEGRTYAWQVQAFGPSGSSPLSSLFSFIALGITDTPAPTFTATPTLGTPTPTPFKATEITPIDIIPYPTLNYARSVHVIKDKNLLLVGDGDKLKLFSAEPDPEFFSETESLNNPIIDIDSVLSLEGKDLALVAGYDLYVIDITDENNPQIIIPSPGWDRNLYSKALAVLFFNNYLYIGTESKGVRKFKLENDGFSNLDSFNTSSSVYGLSGFKNYSEKQNLYIAASTSGLRIRSLFDNKETSVCDTPGSAYSIALGTYDNDLYQYAFVADFQQGLRVLDITKDNACSEKASFHTQGYAVDVKLLFERWGVPSIPNQITNFAYIANRRNFLILDVTDPLKPKPYAIYPNANVMDIAVDVECPYVHIFAAAGTDGVLIFEQVLDELNFDYSGQPDCYP